MKHILVLLALAGTPALLIGCGDDDKGKGKSEAKVDTYFGWVLGSKDTTAVAMNVDKPDANGNMKVRAYVCDGLGPPRGKAIWFTGTVDKDQVNRRGLSVTMKSAGGHETLVIDHLSEPAAEGSFTNADGEKRQFAASPATGGAGIYEVTLDEGLKYKGRSTNGSKLTAQSDKRGHTKGTIETTDGEKLDFTVRSLALATPAELSTRGLSDTYRRYVKNNQVPGEYVAVIAPGGSYWLGRSGSVRTGSPGAQIIGLDKKC